MIDYEKIAKTIVTVCARVTEGNTVYIRGRQDCAHFCELMALECRNHGAYPLIETLSDQYKLADLRNTPLHVIKTMPHHVKALVEETDFVICVGMQPKDPLPFRLLPPERIAAERISRKGITDIILAHPEKRWLGIAYPSKEQAALYGVSSTVYHDMIWNAIDIDYVQLARKAEKIASFIENSSQIRITNRKGTDITLYTEGRPVLKDDGIIDDDDLKKGDKIANLPAGEVYTTPHEEKSEGKVVFDFVFSRGITSGTLPLTVSEGKVKVVDNSQESLLFTQILSHSTGHKDIIGEIGFGLNPHITTMVGNQLTDEKIVGTVHLALGENRSYGGKNQSDLHWDLVISEPTVWVDNCVLIKNGSYCIPV
jgi:aminopeptidase